MTSLKDIYEAEKQVVGPLEWREGHRTLDLRAPLEIDEIVVEGLQLIGRVSPNLPDRNVTFQIQIHAAGRKSVHLERVCWKPNHQHNNLGLGPTEWQNFPIDGSHRHVFEFNYLAHDDRMRAGGKDLPVAVPFDLEPATFEEFIILLDAWFRISGLSEILPAPEWERGLFDG